MQLGMKARVGRMLLIGLAWSVHAAVWAHGPQRHKEPALEQPKAQAAAPGPEADVLKIIADYRAAMEARSIERLEGAVDPDLLVLEGVHKNVGWADYRDNHIGPEMREWKSFRVKDPKILEIAVVDAMAYVVQEATFEIAMADKNVILAGAETFVLKKGPAGWRIAHLHFSGKRQEPQEPKR